MDINQSEHLDAHDMCGHTGAVATAAFLAENRNITLGDAGNLSHDIAVCPWRAALIDVRHSSVPSAAGAYLVNSLSGSTDNLAFLDVAGYPVVEIRILQLNTLSICCKRKYNKSQKD